MQHGRTIWEVDLEVIGDINVENSIEFKHQKGFDLDQFYSKVKIRTASYGITASVTAYAPNGKLAYEAALLYFGKMINVLSFEINVPLELKLLAGESSHYRNNNIRRIVKKNEFIDAFGKSRRLEECDEVVLKALSWFSKGRISQNPFDKFVAFWMVIEILGCKYYTETERTKGEAKAKNKIYQCFIDNFGKVDTWGLPDKWIDQMYELRNKIVHGGLPINIDSIMDIQKYLMPIEQRSYILLKQYMEVSKHPANKPYANSFAVCVTSQ